MAGAGGLDEPVEHDVRAAPTIALRDAMAAAADRDSVAAEYATGYAVTFELGLPALARALDDGLRPRAATVELYLALLAAVPDTLIARKRGRRAAERVSAGAARVLAAGGVRSDAGQAALAGVRRVAPAGRQRAQPRHDGRPGDGGAVRRAAGGASVILLVSVSARMLAELATREGHDVVAVDRFGDLDLQRLCPSVSIARPRRRGGMAGAGRRG